MSVPVETQQPISLNLKSFLSSVSLKLSEHFKILVFLFLGCRGIQEWCSQVMNEWGKQEGIKCQLLAIWPKTLGKRPASYTRDIRRRCISRSYLSCPFCYPLSHLVPAQSRQRIHSSPHQQAHKVLLWAVGSRASSVSDSPVALNTHASFNLRVWRD